jgi:hypothetical protein
MNATAMVLDAFFEFMGKNEAMCLPQLPEPENVIVMASDERDAFLSIYSPLADTALLKNNPDDFENLRNCYRLRREPSAYRIVLK